MELPDWPINDFGSEFSNSGSDDNALLKIESYLRKTATTLSRKTDTSIIKDPNFIIDLDIKLLELRYFNIADPSFRQQIEDIAKSVSSIHMFIDKDIAKGSADFKTVSGYISELRILLKFFNK